MPQYTFTTQNGRTLYQPGVVSITDTSAFASTGNPNASNICIVAQSNSGPPAGATKPDGTPEDQMVFQSATDATAKLKGGDALYIAQRAFANGASTIYFNRPSSATAASATLYDVNSASALTLRSVDYSSATNSLYALIETGTNQGKRVTISDGTAANTLRQDNLYKLASTIYYNSAHASNASAATLTINSTGVTSTLSGYKMFTLHYTGSATTCTFTIAGGNLTITSSTAGESPAAFVLANYTTATLIAAINSFVPTSGASLGVTGLYVATMVYGGVGGNNPATNLTTAAGVDIKGGTPNLLSIASAPDLNLPYSSYPTLGVMQQAITSAGAYVLASVNSDTSMLTSTFDYLTAVNIKDIGNVQNITAILQEVVNFLNGSGGTLVYATRTGGLPPANATTYLVGGTDGGTPTNNNWQSAFDQAKNLNVGIIICGSSSLAIQQMAVTHANTMSDGTQGRNERIALLGCANAETLTTAQTNAATYNSAQVSYIWPGIKDYDPTGIQRDALGQPAVVPLPGYYAAGDIAGKLASTPTRNSLSQQPISIRGLQTVPSDQNLIDAANSGILALAKSTPQANGTAVGFSIYWAVTTYVGSQNYALHELSVTRILQVVSKSLREDLLNWKIATQPVISPDTKAQIVSRVTGVLTGLSGTNGILVGDSTSPAFTVFIPEFKAGQAWVSLCVQPAIPLNFISILVTARPYQTIVNFTTSIPFGG